MPTVTLTYDYVYFATGPSYTRQPRSAAGPGGFTLITSQSGGTLQSGDSFSASSQPGTQTVGATTYTFAFTNVSGGIPAGQTTPSSVTVFMSDVSTPPVTVESEPIVVLVVYVPTGGGGHGGTGAMIDSFNETTGQLFSDTFVTVSPDPGGPPPPLTTSGNVYGYVDTTNNTETITALSPTSPTGVNFDLWAILYPPAGANVTGANNASLVVGSGTTVYALAFYKAPPTQPLTQCEIELQNYNKIRTGSPPPGEVLLSYYLKLLSACRGPQYTVAVNDIKARLKELEEHPENPPTR
jgi:hypothetical protein